MFESKANIRSVKTKTLSSTATQVAAETKFRTLSRGLKPYGKSGISRETVGLSPLSKRRSVPNRDSLKLLGEDVFIWRIAFHTAMIVGFLCAALSAASVAAGHLRPGGRQIAYLTHGRGIQTIYAFDLDAQRTVQMSRAPFGYCCGPVVWSPDRMQLVVTYTPNTSQSEFYIVTVNGRFRRNLSTLNQFTSIESLAWSPDGRFLMFEIQGTSTNRIYKTEVDSDGEAISLTDADAFNFGAAWSPDGQQIAFSSLQATGAAISVMNADGSAPRQLSPVVASFHEPIWSPDGQRIAFLQYVGGVWDVLVMNSDGSELRQLTHEARVMSTLAWSPDGARIAFAGFADGNEEIFVVNVSDGIQQRLTFTDAREFSPVWSSDGRLILFTLREDNNYDIGVVGADGSGYQRVVDNPERDFAPVWLQFGES